MSVGLHSSLEEVLAHVPEDEASPVEFSIVMPCLNEADTFETRIRKAQRTLREHNTEALPNFGWNSAEARNRS
jgi:hypothetical protein